MRAITNMPRHLRNRPDDLVALTRESSRAERYQAMTPGISGAGLSRRYRSQLALEHVGRFFTNLTTAGLTGLLAALSVILLAGGYITIRRAPL
jgi:hypothetical protein